MANVHIYTKVSGDIVGYVQTIRVPDHQRSKMVNNHFGENSHRYSILSEAAAEKRKYYFTEGNRIEACGSRPQILLSGKDMATVAYGSVFDNNEKVNIVKRVILGLDSMGVQEIVFMPDYFGIGVRAMEDLDVSLTASFLDSFSIHGGGDSGWIGCRCYDTKPGMVKRFFPPGSTVGNQARFPTD